MWRPGGWVVLGLVLACGSSAPRVSGQSAGDGGTGAGDGGGGDAGATGTDAGGPSGADAGSPGGDGGSVADGGPGDGGSTTGGGASPGDGGAGNDGGAVAGADGGSGSPTACTPATCASAGKSCGAVPDGCGGTLSCGACPAGQSCGGGGIDGVCGATAPSGAPRWARVLSTSGDDLLWGFAPDGQGGAVALWYASDEHALRLDHVSGGDLAPLRTYPILPGQVGYGDADAAGLVLGASGRLYLLVSTFNDLSGGGRFVDLGAGRFSGGAVARIGPDGSFEGYVAHGGFDDGFGAFALLAVSGDEDVVAWQRYIGTLVRLVRAGSDLVLYGDDPQANTGPLATEGCWAAAFTPEGDLVCGGAALPDGAPVNWLTVRDPGDPRFLLEPAVTRLDLAGHVLWTRTLPVTGMVTGVGVSAIGTVVAAGLFRGSGSFGGDRLEGPATGGSYAGFLVTAEADGSPRWARTLEEPAVGLAVDPVGRAAVATARFPLTRQLGGGWMSPYRWAAEDGEGSLLYYDLAGTFHWARPIPARTAALGFLDHDVLVGGTWSGSFDFGFGPQTSRGDDGFVMELAP